MGITVEQKRISVIKAFQANDQQAMDSVYQNIFPKFRNYVFKNNGNEDQAKDTFQDAFIVCWKNIKNDKLSENGNVEAYLFKIAKNKWTDYLRSAGYKKTVSTEGILNLDKTYDDAEVDEVNEAANRNALQLALNKLGQNCKTLLNLFYFERKSMNEISQVMNLASASARNQKYRCMEKLRQLSLEIKNNG